MSSKKYTFINFGDVTLEMILADHAKLAAKGLTWDEHGYVVPIPLEAAAVDAEGVSCDGGNGHRKAASHG
jgi:hypothetical protein